MLALLWFDVFPRHSRLKIHRYSFDSEFLSLLSSASFFPLFPSSFLPLIKNVSFKSSWGLDLVNDNLDSFKSKEIFKPTVRNTTADTSVRHSFA